MPSSGCGTVSMTKYWSYVATPLFFGVISFGLFTLFTADDIQLVGKSQVRSAVSNIGGKDKATVLNRVAATPEPGTPATQPDTPLTGTP